MQYGSVIRMDRVSVRLGQPTDRKPPFKFSAFTRVGFSDTDAQGIVDYGRYLPYFDHARERQPASPAAASRRSASGEAALLRTEIRAQLRE
jgi:acyl-CoA thioesterase FadM